MRYLPRLLEVISLILHFVAMSVFIREAYRVMMNTITGSAVYGIVIGIAIYMLCKSRKLQKEGDMR